MTRDEFSMRERHLSALKRRHDFLQSKGAQLRNSFDKAELSALDWVLAQSVADAEWLPPLCRYLSDTLAAGTPNEQAVARTVMLALPLPLKRPLTPEAVRDMLAGAREVFDASGPEAPQVVRDVIEYVESWLTVYTEKPWA